MLNLIKFLFLRLLNITKNKYYIVFEDGQYKDIKITHIPHTIYIPKEKKYYMVISVVSEIVNETLVYNWIKVKETAI